MARIAGVNIPTNKRVEIALTYIHGIGRTTARQITEKLGITPERRVQLVERKADKLSMHDRALGGGLRSGLRVRQAHRRLL